MNSMSNINMFIAHGPSRALTRGTVNYSGQGNITDKKLLADCFKDRRMKTFRLCKNARCKTCPYAGKEQIEDKLSLDVFCKNKNLIYLIHCKECELSYIGQTSTELHLRINNHRADINKFGKNKTYKEIELAHFQMHSFNKIDIFILEDKIPNMNKRLDLENIYICKMKTLFPYGLNSKLNGEGNVNLELSCIYSKCNMFQDFNNIDTSKRRFKRGKGKGNKGEIDFKDFQELCKLEYKREDILRIRKFIFGCKNSKLKKFCAAELCKFKFANPFAKLIIIDLLKFKMKVEETDSLFQIKHKNKEYCTINFLDINFERLNIPQLLQESNSLFPLREVLEISAAYKYSNTLKKRICNYNFFCKNLDLIEDIQCLCANPELSKFIDTEHNHIVTGDLAIVEDNVLRDLMRKGTKFRLRKKMGIGKTMFSIRKDLDFFIAKMARKYNWPVEAFREWRQQIILNIKEKISTEKDMKTNRGQFCNFKIFREINKLKDKFIITTVDKAANNFGFMCKVFLKEILLKELETNSTYSLVKTSKRELDNRILALYRKHKLKTNSLFFPYLFPTIKFHKKPTKFRFVTCGTGCYNYVAGRKFFQYLNNIFLEMKKEENFVIQNNSEVLKFLNENEVDSVHTFDFENLYTNLPHDKLLEVCLFLFEEFNAAFDINKRKWLELCKFNIKENYVYNGIHYYKQIAGIPMGGKYSSALANLFLHCYERKIINKSLIHGYRFIDDLLLINEENVDSVINCYPKELQLKKTNYNSKEGTFLDIKIELFGRRAKLGVFDKRTEFDFSCQFLCCYDSNISLKVFRSVIFNEVLRIRKICNNKKDFWIAVNKLRKNLLDNAFPKNIFGIEDFFLEKSLELKE